ALAAFRIRCLVRQAYNALCVRSHRHRLTVIADRHKAKRGPIEEMPQNQRSTGNGDCREQNEIVALRIFSRIIDSRSWLSIAMREAAVSAPNTDCGTAAG